MRCFVAADAEPDDFDKVLWTACDLSTKRVRAFSDARAIIVSRVHDAGSARGRLGKVFSTFF